MKQTIMMLVFLLNAIGSTLMAEPTPPIDKHVRAAFAKQFPQAKYVSWVSVKQEDMYMVRFVSNECSQVAYLDREGQILANARAVTIGNLPSTVSRFLEKEYKNFQISDAVELVMNDELSYMVNLANHKTRYTLQVYANGSAREIRKEKLKTQAE